MAGIMRTVFFHRHLRDRVAKFEIFALHDRRLIIAVPLSISDAPAGPPQRQKGYNYAANHHDL